MTPEQRFDIVLYRLNSAKSLLDEIKDHKRLRQILQEISGGR